MEWCTWPKGRGLNVGLLLVTLYLGDLLRSLIHVWLRSLFLLSILYVKAEDHSTQHGKDAQNQGSHTICYLGALMLCGQCHQLIINTFSLYIVLLILGPSLGCQCST